MSKLSSWILCFGLVAAGLIGTTLSLPLQAPAMILIGAAGLVSVPVVRQGNYNMYSLIPVLFAIVYFLSRAWFSPVVDLAMEDAFLILAGGIIYLICGNLYSAKSVKIALSIIVMGLMILHLISASMQLNGGQGYSLVRLFADGLRPEENTITGMYGYRGSFANFAVIAGFLSLSMGVWGRWGKSIRIGFVILGVVSLVFVVFADSRSAIVSLSSACGVFAFVFLKSVANHEKKLKNRLLGAATAIAIIVFIAAIFGLLWVFQKRAHPSVHGTDVAFNSEVRLAFWPMAVEQFADHPIIGAGSRSYSYECFKYWNPNLGGFEANPEFVHNEYLQVLADYGLLGFVLLIMVLGIHLVFGVKRVGKIAELVGPRGIVDGSNAMALAISGSTGIVAMCVHAIFDFRTHFMANLLLLVCCLTWVLPVLGIKREHSNSISRITTKWAVTIMLAIMSVSAMHLGVKHLRGGLPLLENKMATEAGSWQPDAVDRGVWIPSLEAAIEIAPTYRRHLKLGSLYRLTAEELDGGAKKKMMEKAVFHYQKAAERHPYEPVAPLNLASVFTRMEDYNQASVYFKQARRLGFSRDYWLKINLKQINMERLWARDLWGKKDYDGSKRHYSRAIDLLHESSRGYQWERVYLVVVIEYARLLDERKEFNVADELFKKAESELPPYVISSLDHNIRREIGEHYLKKAKYLWYNRKTEEAYLNFKKSEFHLGIHGSLLKGEEDKLWSELSSEVKKTIEFLQRAGIDG